MSDEPNEISQTNLNLETGKIEWKDLQRFYAQGVVLVVEKSVDLVETAYALAKDNHEVIEQLIKAGDIAKADDERALRWHEEDSVFWAVVLSPWVVIQEIT